MKLKKKRPHGFLNKQGKVWFVTHSVDRYLPDGTSRRVREKHRLGEYANKDLARYAADQFLASLPSVAKDSRVTLRQFVENHFKPHHVQRLKESTQEHYDTILGRHVLPAFGDRRLDRVDFESVQKLIAYKLSPQLTDTNGKIVKRKYSTQVAVHIRNVISAIYAYAKRSGHFSQQRANPAEGVQVGEMIRKPTRALSHEEAQRLLAALPSPCYEAALIALTCSLNRAEWLALQYSALNLNDTPKVSGVDLLPPRSLIVRANYFRSRLTTPKTPQRRRIVPLSTSAVAALQVMKERAAWKDTDDFVFAGSKRGKPLNVTNLENRVFKPILRTLGMPWVGFHALRHSWATFAEHLNFTVDQRVSGLGHAEVTQSLRYTHASIDSRRPGIEQIDQLLKHERQTGIQAGIQLNLFDQVLAVESFSAPKGHSGERKERGRSSTKAREDAA